MELINLITVYAFLYLPLCLVLTSLVLSSVLLMFVWLICTDLSTLVILRCVL